MVEGQETLAYLLIFVFGIVFFVILENTVIGLDTSGWTFTGATFLIAFLPFIPWLFLIACLVIPTLWMVKK